MYDVIYSYGTVVNGGSKRAIVELGPHEKLFEASSHVCDHFKLSFSVKVLTTRPLVGLSVYSQNSDLLYGHQLMEKLPFT